MNTQEMINKLSTFNLSRRNKEELKYDRKIHNQEIRFVIAELSEDCDE